MTQLSLTFGMPNSAQPISINFNKDPHFPQGSASCRGLRRGRQGTVTRQEAAPWTAGNGENEATPAFFKPLVLSQLMSCEGTSVAAVELCLLRAHLEA